MAGEESTVLIVRHLPSQLSLMDRQDLLKHFGAIRVRCFGNKGCMKHTAFAMFDSLTDAAKALERLHQKEILGCRLNVAFSNSQMNKYHPSMVDPVSTVPSDKIFSETQQQKAAQDAKQKAGREKITEEINSAAPRWGLEYAFNPSLQYMYPSPTVNILTNMANALASVPKFYVQALHLMNKMNLPPPFGPVTPTPPIPEGQPPPPPPLPVSESSESEIESDEESRKITSKKRVAPDMSRVMKVARLQIGPLPVRNEFPSQPGPKPEEVFEQPQAPLAKKIEFKLTQAISESIENNSLRNGQAFEAPRIPTGALNYTMADSQSTDSLGTWGMEEEAGPVPGEGFGRIEPQLLSQDAESSSSSEEEEWSATRFISSRRLRKGCLSHSEVKNLSILKRYEAGEPTPRLYIKNLAKQTTEKDLHYLFGKYVDWDNEDEKSMFDIRLMKEGRMKGQAFITLPDEHVAKEALTDIHTFILHDKPIIVQFARSAKPKDSATEK